MRLPFAGDIHLHVIVEAVRAVSLCNGLVTVGWSLLADANLGSKSPKLHSRQQMICLMRKMLSLH